MKLSYAHNSRNNYEICLNRIKEFNRQGHLNLKAFLKTNRRATFKIDMIILIQKNEYM